MASSLCLLLVSCGTSRNAVQGLSDPRELAKSVLVIEKTLEGHVTHAWRPASGFDLSVRLSQAGIRTGGARIVPAVWQRDCEAELKKCIRDCMGSDLGEDWEHLVQPPGRKLGGKHAECRRRCWSPYQDCVKQNADDAAKAVDSSSVERAIDWLKRHREELRVGAVVVIAGVAFVVVVAGSGGGALVLAPTVLMVSSDMPPEPRTLAVMP